MDSRGRLGFGIDGTNMGTLDGEFLDTGVFVRDSGGGRDLDNG